MEQEDAIDLLQCWLAIDNFQQQLSSQHGHYDATEAQNDAMVIYDKWALWYLTHTNDIKTVMLSLDCHFLLVVTRPHTGQGVGF